MDISALVGKYGFPILAAFGMGYLVYYIWTWTTKEVKPIISETQAVLVALIERIRILDNDLIRLNEKVKVILQLKDKNHKN